MAGTISLRSLPPLNALKGFEAAARLGSFRAAADELNVTHAAISHQIRLLETDLAAPLFRREGRRVFLTPEGKLFYEHTRQALELLIAGAGILRHAHQDAELRIETYITVAIRWLSHRLPRFREKFPDILFSVNTHRTEWWFDETNTNVAVVYVDRPLPDSMRARRLFPGVLFPVCAPELIGSRMGEVTAETLLDLPLIQVSSATGDWPRWFSAAGITPPERHRYQRVDTYALALEMALRGDGVAMLNGPFADDELSAGTLIRPVSYQAASGGEWAVVYWAKNARDRKVRSFVNWILSEVESGNSD